MMPILHEPPEASCGLMMPVRHGWRGWEEGAEGRAASLVAPGQLGPISRVFVWLISAFFTCAEGARRGEVGAVWERARRCSCGARHAEPRHDAGVSRLCLGRIPEASRRCLGMSRHVSACLGMSRRCLGDVSEGLERRDALHLNHVMLRHALRDADYQRDLGRDGLHDGALRTGRRHLPWGAAVWRERRRERRAAGEGRGWQPREGGGRRAGRCRPAGEGGRRGAHEEDCGIAVGLLLGLCHRSVEWQLKALRVHVCLRAALLGVRAADLSGAGWRSSGRRERWGLATHAERQPPHPRSIRHVGFAMRKRACVGGEKLGVARASRDASHIIGAVVDPPLDVEGARLTRDARTDDLCVGVDGRRRRLAGGIRLFNDVLVLGLGAEPSPRQLRSANGARRGSC